MVNQCTPDTLCDAVSRRDIALLIRLLAFSTQTELNQGSGPRNDTPLHIAAHKGDLVSLQVRLLYFIGILHLKNSPQKVTFSVNCCNKLKKTTMQYLQKGFFQSIFQKVFFKKYFFKTFQQILKISKMHFFLQKNASHELYKL